MSRRGLFWKYAIALVLLVGVTGLVSAAVQLVLEYQEHQAALVAVQREKAAGAAGRIDAFLRETERLLAGAPAPRPTGDAPSTEQLRTDFQRLLRQAPPILEASYLDPAGHEQVRVSRLALTEVGTQRDRSQEPAFWETRAVGSYYGPVYFRDQSEPFLTLGAATADGGVAVAEVNLKFIWDVVDAIHVGNAGYAYVVDDGGQLVAHPEISLVLQRADLSELPQIQALARAGVGEDEPSVARDIHGQQVLTARAAIDPPGWSVFVEQPLEEAFAPVRASLLRTAALAMIGLLLAVVVSIALARRMVTPIRALREGATRLGEGALDARIEVHSGDELESLADSFNRMAGQLGEVYRTLEQRVEARTTELEAAMQQVESANRHKSEFLASMSHELRTPLNAIIGFSDALAEQFFGPLNAKQARYVQHILTSGHHLLALINDILDLSKVEAGRMDLERERFSLAEAIDSGLTMVRERATHHGIELRATVDPTIDIVMADERKIRQVIYNLLTNAVKFTPAGGRVEIRACRLDKAIEVSVHDTGIGIPSRDRERIFEAFQQGSLGVSQTQEGTGLGLALSRQYVQLHGGRLWVGSEPGAGSTFMFTLPDAEPVEAEMDPIVDVDGESGVPQSTAAV